MGAHPTKVGLNPVLVDLMERRIITALALTGAVIIHDFELTLLGRTSEEVDTEINTGRFGMAEETGRLLNEAITRGVRKGLGIGEALGTWIEERRFPNRKTSLLAAGVRLGIPVTVHVAIGTDIIHMHPAMEDRKSTRLNSSHSQISYAVFCLKKKKTTKERDASHAVT